jgi:hypothetical protein
LKNAPWILFQVVSLQFSRLMKITTIIYKVAREPVSPCAAASTYTAVFTRSALAFEAVEVANLFEDSSVEPYLFEGFFANVTQLYRQIRARGDFTVWINPAVIEASHATANPLPHV